MAARSCSPACLFNLRPTAARRCSFVHSCPAPRPRRSSTALRVLHKTGKTVVLSAHTPMLHSFPLARQGSACCQEIHFTCWLKFQYIARISSALLWPLASTLQPQPLALAFAELNELASFLHSFFIYLISSWFEHNSKWNSAQRKLSHLAQWTQTARNALEFRFKLKQQVKWLNVVALLYIK